jgi:enediyne biosynthesis protein E4
MTRTFCSFFLLLCVSFSCSKKKETLFSLLPPEKTGVTFANLLQETEQQNILTYEYFYNGGGVAAGDFNNDGLTDLFFTGNQVANKLYVNKGDLQFEDVSARAGIGGRQGAWKTGVSLADVNADGRLDIYVCYSGPNSPGQRKNQLFINTSSTGGPLSFKEEAHSYGLDHAGYSTQAAFFDYDGDGDLDCYLMNHNLRNYQRQEAHIMRNARDEFAGDKLFINEGGKFVEISQEAGIKSNPLGFGLGLAIADINGDNRPDIYVGNDYVEDDYLYINNGNGTFTDVLRDKISHTSRFSMGLDIADINNDTLPDIFTLDMLPEDNTRQKLLTFPDNWNSYQSTLQNGFWHQNMRNMLQLNNGNGTFSEIGQLAGVSNTDWSWSALFADFDNDGWKDLFISNGELKDLTNADFIKYAADEEMKQASGQAYEALLAQVKRMPASQTKHYIFQNKNGLYFENKQKSWGFDAPAVASGAVYADLDNDGDIDIVTNTNNGIARIYENNTIRGAGQVKQNDKFTTGASQANYLKIRLKGSAGNPFGVGAKVFVYGTNTVQYQELAPVRGFQSSMYDALHFGLGTDSHPVQVKILWADGRVQVLEQVEANQSVVVNYAEAADSSQTPAQPKTALFTEAGNQLPFIHQENPANDYNRQSLLPYMYSYTGARMAKGDINNDGLDDLYVGGARNQAGAVFLGTKQGPYTTFTRLPGDMFKADSAFEDKDALFFDADGDKDLDLYIVSGDYGLSKNHPGMQDRIYFRDAGGNYRRNKGALPQILTNGSFVKSLDIENDGDLDLFIGGGVVPGVYPVSEPSYLLRNDGRGNFMKVAQFTLGLTTDAVVADINKDGYADILVVGEWMSPTVLYNRQGQFSSGTPLMASGTLSGWWNRIAASDLDGDGDLDFVLGNMGLNSQIKASRKEPITLAAADFDQNGTIDPVMSYFIDGVSYPAMGRDEALEQIVSLRKKFTSYESYSQATIHDFFTKEQLQQAAQLQITTTETIILENIGAAFAVYTLPLQAQNSPVYAIAINDFTNDGIKDILLCGNNSTYRLRIGKMDANKGVLLKGTGGLKYEYVPQHQSGFRLQGDIKDVQQINDSLLVFFINNEPVKVYQRNTLTDKPDTAVNTGPRRYTGE